MTEFKRKPQSWLVVWCLWFALCACIFDRYAYEINQFGAKVRTFLVHGQTSLRVFEDSIPVSYSASQGNFISPFYVVHYGILFSEGLRNDKSIWSIQQSMPLWNVQPSKAQLESREVHFKASADWISKHVVIQAGRYHLPYNFDWSYKRYPGGMLKSPWWSGLTDGYGILLMLRAYDYFGDATYLDVAEKLYASVTTRIEEGGSLRDLAGCPFIEEYVDPRVHPLQMSGVFNGAVYAAIGVESFESYFADGRPAVSSAELFDCIGKNISSFSMGWWSFYDSIGTPANIKYHRINSALAQEVLDRLGSGEAIRMESILGKWATAVRHPGVFYLWKGPRSFSYYQFIGTFLIVVIAPYVAFKTRPYFLAIR